MIELFLIDIHSGCHYADRRVLEVQHTCADSLSERNTMGKQETVTTSLVGEGLVETQSTGSKSGYCTNYLDTHAPAPCREHPKEPENVRGGPT